jgi:hypothetical protein
MRNVMETGINWYSLQPQHIIGGTIFTHKNTHKVTWRSPDGVTMNEIDHTTFTFPMHSNRSPESTHRSFTMVSPSPTGKTGPTKARHRPLYKINPIRRQTNIQLRQTPRGTMRPLYNLQ